jgi:hypothetical protein
MPKQWELSQALYLTRKGPQLRTALSNSVGNDVGNLPHKTKLKKKNITSSTDSAGRFTVNLESGDWDIFFTVMVSLLYAR